MLYERNYNVTIVFKQVCVCVYSVFLMLQALL